jgi:hypothetical protein
MSKGQKLLFYTLFLFAIFFGGAVPRAEAACIRHDWLWRCWPVGILDANRCSAPIDYLCCDSQAECDLYNPYCYRGGYLGIQTALGCLVTSEPKYMLGQLYRWAIIIGASVSFLVIIYGGFTIVTSGGDVKRVAQGREFLVAALTGLALIILSILILNFIGVKIFNLLGFNV